MNFIDNLEDNWMEWVKLMRQVGTTSPGDDAHGRSREQALTNPRNEILSNTCGCVRHRLEWYYVRAWTSIYARQWTRARHSPRRWAATLWCQRVLTVAGVAMKRQRA